MAPSGRAQALSIGRQELPGGAYRKQHESDINLTMQQHPSVVVLRCVSDYDQHAVFWSVVARRLGQCKDAMAGCSAVVMSSARHYLYQRHTPLPAT